MELHPRFVRRILDGPGHGTGTTASSQATEVVSMRALLGGGLGYLVGRLSPKAEPVAARTDHVSR